jgi:hypothetical protein
MSAATEQRLARLAGGARTKGRKVNRMQLATLIIEDALSGIPEH